MSIPDFERAEYSQPQVIEGDVMSVGTPVARGIDSALPLALLYGAIAALLGGIGYALIWSFGFMVSIVAIGIAYLIARAMMTATGGRGGRPYQVAAVIFTYFAVTWGELLKPLWVAHHEGVPLLALMNSRVLMFALFGPFLELQDGINGILGIVILGIGLRAAWRMAGGGPGFGRGGRMRPVDPFGLR